MYEPDYIIEFIRTHREERRRLNSTDQTDRKKFELNRAEAEAMSARRLVLFEKGILDGRDGEAKERVASAKAQPANIDLKHEAMKFAPTTASTYVSALEEVSMSTLANDGNSDAKVRDDVRGLDAGIFVSAPEEDGIPFEFKTRLTARVSVGASDQASSRFENLGGCLVAEEGLEPPTRGL